MSATYRYLGSLVYIAYLGDRPLYIGQTGRDIRSRLREHRLFPWWTPDVYYVVHSCRSTAEAMTLEARLVAELDPPHNVNLSLTNRKTGRLPRGEAQRRAHIALQIAGRPMTSTELRRVTGIRGIGSALKKLSDGGAIVRVGSGSMPEHGRIQSVWALAERAAS